MFYLLAGTCWFQSTKKYRVSADSGQLKKAREKPPQKDRSSQAKQAKGERTQTNDPTGTGIDDYYLASQQV
jgi:hypothetical protein